MLIPANRGDCPILNFFIALGYMPPVFLNISLKSAPGVKTLLESENMFLTRQTSVGNIDNISALCNVCFNSFMPLIYSPYTNSFFFNYLDAPDIFQVPTLDSLQPNLDEFMEHFESFTSKT